MFHRDSEKYFIHELLTGERHGHGKYQVKGEDFVDGDWEHGVRVKKESSESHHRKSDGGTEKHKKHSTKH